MSVPGIVEATLAGEEVAARVPLGGDDELFVTPSHSLIYRAEGLLSDESIEEFPHEAERLSLSAGRRKTRFTLDYPLEDTREFTVPSSAVDDVLHPVLAGVLSGNGITSAGETVLQTYRFSELTVIVTTERLVKHIGEAVWDDDYEEYGYADVTGLSFEPGTVSTQIVLEVEGRPRRIKAPNEGADDLRERLQRALFSYHEVESLEALNEKLGLEEDGPSADPAEAFGEGVGPLQTGSSTDDDGDADTDSTTDSAGVAGGVGGTDGAAESDTASATTPGTSDAGGAATGAESTEAAGASETPSTGADGFEGSGFESATVADDALLERLEALETAVEEQSTIVRNQQETIEQLIEELRRGR